MKRKKNHVILLDVRLKLSIFILNFEPLSFVENPPDTIIAITNKGMKFAMRIALSQVTAA